MRIPPRAARTGDPPSDRPVPAESPPPSRRRPLVVRTRQGFPVGPTEVWPLLSDAHVRVGRSPVFRLGVPRPIACRLPSGRGGVGEERECLSDQGAVHQRIRVWEPAVRLAFQLERTDLPFVRHVTEMTDVFDVAPTAFGSEVTRTTTVRLRGRFPRWRSIAFGVALRSVHRHVFTSWLRLVEAPRGRAPRPASAGPVGR